MRFLSQFLIAVVLLAPAAAGEPRRGAEEPTAYDTMKALFESAHDPISASDLTGINLGQRADFRPGYGDNPDRIYNNMMIGLPPDGDLRSSLELKWYSGDYPQRKREIERLLTIASTNGSGFQLRPISDREILFTWAVFETDERAIVRKNGYDLIVKFLKMDAFHTWTYIPTGYGRYSQKAVATMPDQPEPCHLVSGAKAGEVIIEPFYSDANHPRFDYRAAASCGGAPVLYLVVGKTIDSTFVLGQACSGYVQGPQYSGGVIERRTTFTGLGWEEGLAKARVALRQLAQSGVCSEVKEDLSNIEEMPGGIVALIKGGYRTVLRSSGNCMYVFSRRNDAGGWETHYEAAEPQMCSPD